MAIKESVTPQEVLDFLNSLMEVDPATMNSIFSARFQCNDAMLNHPTVQCGRLSETIGEVGVIGILNGLFGIDKEGWGVFAMSMENDRPSVITAFKDTRETKRVNTKEEN